MGRAGHGARFGGAVATTTSALVAVLLLALSGCGEKIAIPQPKGLFSVSAYYLETTVEIAGSRSIATAQGALFLVHGDSLSKRNQNFGLIAAVSGLADPRGLCVDDAGQVVFVWEQGAQRLRAYDQSDLAPLNETVLPEIQSGTALTTSRAGIELAPGARTFVYVADPDSGVVHRLAYDDFAGFVSYGILSRSDGDAARFVHEPFGMARDAEDSLLVCDVDTLRNWVIRFNAAPDLSDVAAEPGDPDPWRGRAALFDVSTCNPSAATDFVLGDAAECNESDWQGGPSDGEDAFHAPSSVVVDGLGRLFVADTGNDRIQIFSSRGYFDFLFGSSTLTPKPGSLALIDFRHGGGPDDVNYGAYVFVVFPSSGEVRRFVSSEQYNLNNQDPPPDQ